MESTGFNARNIVTLLGNGDGTFGREQSFYAGAITSLVAADLNGDSFPDLIGGSVGPKEVTVLLGNGDGTFQPGLRISVDPGPQTVAVADLNRDGRPDVITANGRSQQISVFFQQTP